MNVVGYDEEVAAKNGFKIVTYPDGSWESVAVTEEAKALNLDTGIMRPSGSGDAQARTTSYGTCGSSFTDAYMSSALLTFVTGYDVVAPVYNRIAWGVTIVAWPYGINSVGWPGGVSTPAHWQGSGGVLYPDASVSGFATTSGDVQLITGEICYSGNPSDSF